MRSHSVYLNAWINGKASIDRWNHWENSSFKGFNPFRAQKPGTLLYLCIRGCCVILDIYSVVAVGQNPCISDIQRCMLSSECRAKVVKTADLHKHTTARDMSRCALVDQLFSPF